MNTTVQALQDLYVKLGGNLTDTYDTIADGAAVGNYVTIPDMIEACTQIAGSGGGSSLPAVTSADNGSVLTVVNGDWDKAGATSPIEVIEFTVSESGISTVKTAGEIKALVDSGKYLVGVASPAENIIAQISVVMMNFDNLSPVMLASSYQGEENPSLVIYAFTAATINDPFSASLGG